jgi:hypothetical protein
MFKLSTGPFDVESTEVFHPIDHCGWSYPKLQRFDDLPTALAAFNTEVANPKTFMAQVSFSSHFEQQRFWADGTKYENMSGTLCYIVLAKWRRDRTEDVEAYASPGYFFHTLEKKPGITDNVIAESPRSLARVYKRAVDDCEHDFSKKRRGVEEKT